MNDVCKSYVCSWGTFAAGIEIKFSAVSLLLHINIYFHEKWLYFLQCNIKQSWIDISFINSTYPWVGNIAMHISVFPLVPVHESNITWGCFGITVVKNITRNTVLYGVLREYECFYTFYIIIISGKVKRSNSRERRYNSLRRFVSF